ncbi:MAG TPA: response regulator [Bryobacteraceae bacterium]|nr:response regulator [Bryobacteraceae bacterium]
MNGPLNRLSVLLVEDDPDYAALVQQWLDGAGRDPGFLLSWTDSLSSALSRLTRGGIDIVLLDLSLPDSQGIGTFLTLHSRCSGVPVIVLTAADSEPMALQTIRHGGEDYLVKSTCTRELLIRHVSHAVVRHRRQTEAHAVGGTQNKVVAVIGAKGGTGTTTVACTLAAELRGDSDAAVLLADLDLDSGLVGFLMGVNSRFSILDATQNLERLDSTFWESLVTDVGGVHVVPSPGLGHSGYMDASSLLKVVQFAKQLYRWVVLDLGRMRGGTLALLDDTTEVVLVTTDSIASLHEAKRAIEVLCASAVDREHVHLLVNHVDEATETLPTSDLVKLFGIEVCARLPYEGAALCSALVERKLPAESSAFRSNVKRAARKLMGLEEIKRKRTIPGLVSFLTGAKRRKPAPNETVDATNV